MFSTLEQILTQAWQRLISQLFAVAPNVLAMLLILAVGFTVARLTQWTLHRMSGRVQKTLQQWGVSEHYGEASAAHWVARGVFWILFGCAVLMAVNALNTELGSRLVTTAFLYLPRLLTAGLIVLAGLLLARYLARGALIWAVNEGLGPARWIATGVRLGVGLLTFVAATEQLGVAQTAVLVTFVILLSGGVLALALAAGLGSRKRVEQWLEGRAAFLGGQKESRERIEHL